MQFLPSPRPPQVSVHSKLCPQTLETVPSTWEVLSEDVLSQHAKVCGLPVSWFPNVSSKMQNSDCTPSNLWMLT